MSNRKGQGGLFTQYHPRVNNNNNMIVIVTTERETQIFNIMTLCVNLKQTIYWYPTITRAKTTKKKEEN